jgi:hypothetical protein
VQQGYSPEHGAVDAVNLARRDPGLETMDIVSASNFRQALDRQLRQAEERIVQLHRSHEVLIKIPAPRGGVLQEARYLPVAGARKTSGSLRERRTPQAAGNATRRDSRECSHLPGKNEMDTL